MIIRECCKHFDDMSSLLVGDYFRIIITIRMIQRLFKINVGPRSTTLAQHWVHSWSCSSSSFYRPRNFLGGMPPPRPLLLNVFFLNLSTPLNLILDTPLKSHKKFSSMQPPPIAYKRLLVPKFLRRHLVNTMCKASRGACSLTTPQIAFA